MKQFFKTITQHINTVCLSVSVLLLIFSASSQADVVASVSANKVHKGDIFILKVVSDHKADSNDINFSILERDFYMGRPSFSSSFSNINGQHSVRSEWTLSLAPLRAGNLTIPSFEIKGEKTKAITITSTIDALSPDQDELVEFQTHLSKKEVYPGEIVRLESKLIIKTDARRVQNAKLTPPLSVSGGIEITPVEDARQYRQVIDGIESTIIEQNYHLTALNSGQFTIDGPTLSAAIIQHSSNSASNRLIPIQTESEKLTLDVLDKPESYKGTWLPSAKLTLTQKWISEDKIESDNARSLETQVGNPITREITLSAEGISQPQLPDIDVTYPDTIRYYQESPKFTQDGNTVTMTVKQVLIPKTQGDIALPSISLNWWDTTNKTAQTSILEGMQLHVEKSDTPSIQLPTTDSKPQQSVPAETKTVTIIDRGIWPYLTALFAFAWLITLFLLIRSKTAKTMGTLEKDDTSDTYNQLVSAIKKQDGVQTQAALKRWLNENNHLDAQLKSQITAQVDAMMAAIYSSSKHSDKWNVDELLTLLKKANRSAGKKPATDSGLAKL